MWELHAQHRGLQRIEPKVAAYPLMVVLRLRTMVSQEADFRAKLRILRGDQTRVAERTEILARKK